MGNTHWELAFLGASPRVKIYLSQHGTSSGYGKPINCLHGVRYSLSGVTIQLVLVEVADVGCVLRGKHPWSAAWVRPRWWEASVWSDDDISVRSSLIPAVRKELQLSAATSALDGPSATL